MRPALSLHYLFSVVYIYCDWVEFVCCVISLMCKSVIACDPMWLPLLSATARYDGWESNYWRLRPTFFLVYSQYTALRDLFRYQ